MLNKTKTAFVCQFSGRETPLRVFIPIGTDGKGKYGCFFDLNCALAHLRAKKPRGWQAREMTLQRLAEEAGFDLEPATEPGMGPYNRIDPRERDPYTETLEEHLAAKKKKRPPTAAITPPAAKKVRFIEPVPPPNSAADHSGRPCARVVIVDENNARTVAHTSNWLQLLADKFNQPMTHAMPAFFSAGGRGITLYPLLECDGKHLAGADAKVVVTLPSF